MDIKLTSPEDMAPDLSELEKAIKVFEDKFKDEPKGQPHYHLIYDGELNKEVCSKIASMYMKAGWRTAICKTSSDNGERPGLTGLQLYYAF